MALLYWNTARLLYNPTSDRAGIALSLLYLILGCKIDETVYILFRLKRSGAFIVKACMMNMYDVFQMKDTIDHTGGRYAVVTEQQRVLLFRSKDRCMKIRVHVYALASLREGKLLTFNWSHRRCRLFKDVDKSLHDHKNDANWINSEIIRFNVEHHVAV